ncbi:Uma2 family endonuclease [Nonomuraea sp. NPDC059007]|uniref:Uma2 family endonuclease n=1 Tax=Nonomuraea sp. NPDC059007 TaxID=3346692 RepID=UPI00369D323C
MTTRAVPEPTETSTVLPGRPPFTVDDLLRFPDDGNRYELFDGSLLVSPAPTPLHQFSILRLVRLLEEAAPPALEPLSTVNLRVTERDCFIPDVVVVPLAAVEANELMFAPADILLAVEVVSPSTRTRDRSTKPTVYAEAGIPSYWRIEPEALYVYTLDDATYAGPEIYKAGEVARLNAPYEVAFDPGDLVKPRGA